MDKNQVILQIESFWMVSIDIKLFIGLVSAQVYMKYIFRVTFLVISFKLNKKSMSLTQILKMITKILNLNMKADLFSSRNSFKLKKNQTFKLSTKKIPLILNQMNPLKLTYASNLKISPRFLSICMVPQLMEILLQNPIQI